MKSITEKKVVKRRFHKRLIWLILIFVISIFSLKSLMEKHPVPKETQTIEDIKKPVEKPVQVVQKPEKPLSVAQKKQRFKDLLLPAIDSAYAKLEKQHDEIKELIKKEPTHPKIDKLKAEYKAKSNQDLLLKLKPHPKSVTLSQAAIESAWGTSRFFYKANNVFGVWSFNKSEPRIAAGETRGEKTIYLKKYRTIEDSVLDYYKTLAKGRPYHKFRARNYTDPNPYVLVTHLDSYSEKRGEYGRILISVIGHNKFTQYDEKFYPRPPKPKKKPAPKPEAEKVAETKVAINTDTNTSTVKKEIVEAKQEVKKVDTNLSTIKSEQKIEKEIKDINTSKETKIVAKSEVIKVQKSDINETISQ